MTKQELVADIRKLMRDADTAVTELVSARRSKDAGREERAYWRIEKTIVDCHQELSVILDYISSDRCK